MSKQVNKSKNKLINILLSTGLAIFLAACGTGNQQQNQNVGTENPTLSSDSLPLENGGELVWILASAPPTLDAHRATDTTSRNVFRTMVEPLMYFDGNNTLQPLLATGYNQLDDTTWQFTLRQGVYFHDGSYFNADVVRANFERFLDPQNAFTRASFLDMIENVVVIDEYTVNFELSFPFAPFPAQMTNYAAQMYSPLALEADLNGTITLSDNPVGTGPFILDSVVHGDSVRVVRFDDYWRGQAGVDSILFRVIPEASTRLMLVQTGEAHGLEAMSSDVPILDTMPHLDLMQIVTTTYNYIGFNLDRYPLSDIRVRQAITMAINVEDILYGIVEGQGVRSVGPIAPSVIHSPHDYVTPLPFDPVRAREVLVEAGYGDGFTINMWYNDGNSVRSLIAQLVQANLSEIGITVNVSSLEWGAYLEATNNGEHDLFVLGWTGGTGDPDIQVQPLFHSDLIGGGGNRFWYSSEIVDDLIHQGRLETNPERRSEIYRQITEQLIYDSPVISLWHPYVPIVTNGITGLTVNFATEPDFFRVNFTN
ncbi:MAG: ABC transporter substrate-binding protein [Defluviitaleaceae bacterium]|nr:ABC transporter substrate-binding protein [Defluviitaleaceae bacterium]